MYTNTHIHIEISSRAWCLGTYAANGFALLVIISCAANDLHLSLTMQLY